MTDEVKYNWAPIPDFNTLATPKKEDKRREKDSAQEQAAQEEIRTRFHDGLASLYDIFNAGAPFNEQALLKEEKFEQISESKNISDIAKMAAEAFKDGMVLGNYFVKNHTALGCNFMSDFGDFCATCGRIVALAERDWAWFRSNIIPNENRGKNAAATRLKNTKVHRKFYIGLLKKCDRNWYLADKLPMRTINNDFQKYLDVKADELKKRLQKKNHDKKQGQIDEIFDKYVEAKKLKFRYERHTLLEWRKEAKRNLLTAFGSGGLIS